MLRLLDALYGDRTGNVEIRAMREGEPMKRIFAVWPDDRSLLLTQIELLVPTHNVYFGVLLRQLTGGKAEDCEPQVHWLWADVDKKSGATFASLLSSPLPRPQILVDSGNGWHLYWRLAKPADHDTAQAVMNSIADTIGGDHVGDPARILRLPGSLNMKDPANPIPVRILRMRDLKRGYRIGDFPAVSVERRIKATAATGTKGTRSEELFVIALEGVRKGLSNRDIYEQMLEAPGGSKLLEMKTEERRQRWADQSIQKARKSISLPRSPSGSRALRTPRNGSSREPRSTLTSTLRKSPSSEPRTK